ncbi:MAG: RidA family protein, partial [Bryobacteraceae bacterium]|nr:RidA family protein [Bryobacteraceae bacterium]
MCSSLSWAASKKKKKGDEEPVTQVLDFPKDPPAAIVADASRMTFFISALSAKGLLSAQIRDAIRNLMGQSRGAQIVKLRAFVAGSGDLRRVPSLVSEIFTDKRLPLPAVTVVQVGALPLTGAQVLIEATAVDRKPTNPNGLAFIGGQPGSASGVGARLASMLGKASIRAQSVRQVTCFLDGLEFESS